MHVVELADPDSLAIRSHPWSGSASDSSLCHRDLRLHPELVRTALEDLRPWDHTPAIQAFYQLIEWLNSPQSVLETSDCAFNSPTANDSPAFDKALQCSGRLVLLFRDLPQNTDASLVHALTQALARALADEDQDFAWGAVGLTIVPTRFLTLSGPPAKRVGSQLMLSLWAWGDDEREALSHLARTLAAVTEAVRAVG